MTLREQLIRDEGGFQLRAYPDTKGKMTIGVGHNLVDRAISRRAAEMIYDDDLAETIAGVKRRLPWAEAMGEVRFGALVNMSFTMGIGKVLGFRKALAALQAGQWDEAAAQILDSDWARDPEQDNDRCRRVAEQVRTGVWV